MFTRLVEHELQAPHSWGKRCSRGLVVDYWRSRGRGDDGRKNWEVKQCTIIDHSSVKNTNKSLHPDSSERPRDPTENSGKLLVRRTCLLGVNTIKPLWNQIITDLIFWTKCCSHGTSLYWSALRVISIRWLCLWQRTDSLRNEYCLLRGSVATFNYIYQANIYQVWYYMLAFLRANASF